MTGSLATLLVLADGRLPAGGHAHSGGLEAAVAAGRVRDVPDLAGFLHGRLATSGLVAAAFAAAARACLTAGPDHTGSPDHTGHPGHPGHPGDPGHPEGPPKPTAAPDPVPGTSVSLPHGAADRLAALDAGLDARTPSAALRRASRAQGRALLRAGRAMWPLAPAAREPHHPVALGVVAAGAGLGPAAAAVAAAYGAVSGPASAAVRLLGLDPYRVHALLAALAVDCDRVAAIAVDRMADPVDDLPAAGAPLLDVGAEIHASWEVRLFAS